MLGDEYATTVLGCVDGDIATDALVRKAQARLLYLAGHDRIIPNTEIDAHKILAAMLDHAPTVRGKRYAACAIACCGEDTAELVGLASDWLKNLLWPCMSRDSHSVLLFTFGCS